MTRCVGCGAENVAGARFCVKCGAQLSPVPPPPESWRYSGDLEPGRTQQAESPPAGQYTPPAYQQPYPVRSPPPQGGVPYRPAPLVSGLQTGGVPLAQVGFVMGLVVAGLMLVGLIPCLGWLNYFTLMGGKLTIVLCIVAIVTEKNQELRNKALIGLIIAAVAWMIGLVRLVLGGGCL